MVNIVFLGVCDRRRSTLSGVGFSRLNVINLRSTVTSHMFPLPTRSLFLVFAVQFLQSEEASHEAIRIICSNDDEMLFDFTMHLKTVALEAPEPPDIKIYSQRHQTRDYTWTIIADSFPEEISAIPKPGQYNVYCVYEDKKIPIGTLDFYYVPANPLTEERRAAIKSDPSALKFCQLVLACPRCKDGIRTYTGLEQSSRIEQEGFLWYRNLPNEFRCSCGNTKISLVMLRESFHALLGQRFVEESNDISITRLYEKKSLEDIYNRFWSLLQTDSDEPAIQEFLENNPILFHQFTPLLIKKKPRVLGKHVTDFVILSKNSHLVLIEIERPGKQILKKTGGQTQKLTQAIDQVRDWLHEIDEHRQAVLDGMGFRKEQVSAIRGVVIAGRDMNYNEEDLRKLKKVDFGKISFFTYDDLAASLASLIRSIDTL